MRYAVWISAVSSCLLLNGMAAAAPPPNLKALPNEAAVIAEALTERFDVEQRLEAVKLKDVLQMIQDRVGVTLILDVKALNGGGENMVAAGVLTDLEGREITLPAMKKVRVETVLKAVCDQINAVHVIDADHIRITSPQVKDLLIGEPANIPTITGPTTAEEVSVPREDRVRLTPTLTVIFEQTTVAEAAKVLADRGGRNLILSSGAQEKASSKVSFSLTNVTFETAAVTLAEAAGLRVVKQGNVAVLVTPERFKEIHVPTTVPWGLGQTCMGVAAPNTLTDAELETLGKANAGKSSDADAIKRENDKLKENLKALSDKFVQLKVELEKKK